MGWFGFSERGVALGIRGASVPLGAGLAALTLPQIADAADPRASILALSILIAGAAAATALWMRNPPRAAGSPPPPRFSPRIVFADKILWRLVVVTFLLTTTQYAFVGFLALFLSDGRGVAAATAGLAMVGLHALGAVARIGAGRWSDVMGSRVRPLRIIAAVSVVAMLALGLVADASAAVLVPVLFVAALAGVSWNALTFAASAELAPPGAAGTAIGMQNTALGLAAATFLPLFAVLVEATSWNVGFATVALAPLAALLLLRRMPA
jgi:sugar phosphate permease